MIGCRAAFRDSTQRGEPYVRARARGADITLAAGDVGQRQACAGVVQGTQNHDISPNCYHAEHAYRRKSSSPKATRPMMTAADIGLPRGHMRCVWFAPLRVKGVVDQWNAMARLSRAGVTSTGPDAAMASLGCHVT